MQLPPVIFKILDTLERGGEEAYLVGGSVRDMLCGQTPKDFDLTTSATPARMKEIFAGRRLLETGLSHGTLTLVEDGLAVEITTYRVDGGYSDGRHPDAVAFSRRLEEDLARRDFTINAMAWHPDRGLIDPFGGREDLRRGIIRSVGEPERRFMEDGLRILRGARFASRFGFRVEEQTAAAMHSLRSRLSLVAAERLLPEVTGLLCGRAATKVLLQFAPVLFAVLPELEPMYVCPQQTVYHQYDVWEHTAVAVGAAPPEPALRLTMLLHDAGKPACRVRREGVDHFKGHAALSARMAEGILSRLACDSRTKRLIITLVGAHDLRPEPTVASLRRLLFRYGEGTVRRLFACQRADAAGKAERYRLQQWAEVDRLEEILEQVIAQNLCCSLRDMAVKGDDLIAAGVPAGPEVGRLLSSLLSDMIAQNLPNQREALLQHLQKLRKDRDATAGCAIEKSNV